MEEEPEEEINIEPEVQPNETPRPSDSSPSAFPVHDNAGASSSSWSEVQGTSDEPSSKRVCPPPEEFPIFSDNDIEVAVEEEVIDGDFEAEIFADDDSFEVEDDQNDHVVFFADNDIEVANEEIVMESGSGRSSRSFSRLRLDLLASKRSKSVDQSPILIKRPRRSWSAIRMKEIEFHAEKKLGKIKQLFGTVLRSPNNIEFCITDEHYREILFNIHKLFSRREIEDATKYRLIKTLLSSESFNTVVHIDDPLNDSEAANFSEMIRRFESMKLHSYRGDTDENRVPKFDTDQMISGQSISVSMDSYLFYNSYRNQLNAYIDKIFNDLQKTKHKRNHPMWPMINAYSLIFKFRRAILEEILNIVETTIFSPRNTIEAENEQSNDKIRSLVLKTGKQLNIAKHHVFDLTKIFSLLREYHCMPKVLSKFRVDNNGEALTMIALERSRAKTILDQLRGKSVKVEDIQGFVASVDVFNFKFGEETEDQKYLNDQATKYNFPLDPQQKDPLHTIFSAFFKQNKEFFDFIEESLNCQLDLKIKLYLEHKVFCNLLNLIHFRGIYLTDDDFRRADPVVNGLMVSAAAAGKRRRLRAEEWAEKIDEVFKKLCTTTFHLPMFQPPTLGIDINCSEDCIRIAVVVERIIGTSRDHRASVKRYTHLKMGEGDVKRITVIEGVRCHLIIKKKEEILEFQLVSDQDEPLCDEFTIGGLPVYLVKQNPIDWPAIEAIISPKLNNFVNNPVIDGDPLVSFVFKNGHTIVPMIDSAKASRKPVKHASIIRQLRGTLGPVVNDRRRLGRDLVAEIERLADGDPQGPEEPEAIQNLENPEIPEEVPQHPEVDK